MGTAAPGGTYAIYGPAWGQLAAAGTGVNISYRTTQGPNQNIVLVDQKQVEIGMVTMGVALQAWNGTGSWTQGNKFQDIRALFPMYDTPFHGIALKRSGITQMSQLAGKNVGVGPRGGTPGTYFPQMLDKLGYKPAAVRFGSGSDMSGQLQDGLLDAFLFASGVPIALARSQAVPMALASARVPCRRSVKRVVEKESVSASTKASSPSMPATTTPTFSIWPPARSLLRTPKR